jgi:hypothetical protein
MYQPKYLLKNIQVKNVLWNPGALLSNFPRYSWCNGLISQSLVNMSLHNHAVQLMVVGSVGQVYEEDALLGLRVADGVLCKV